MGNFIVVREIYFNGVKVSRQREEKKRLNNGERDQLTRSLCQKEMAKSMDGKMTLYNKLEIELKETYNIEVSERTIMRALKEFSFVKFLKKLFPKDKK